MRNNAWQTRFSSPPADSPDSHNKPLRFNRRYHVVLNQNVARELLGNRRCAEKKRLLASAGLLLPAESARALVRDLLDW